MIYFLLYLFLEIAISIPAFGALGIFGTFFEILFSAFLGVIFLQTSSVGMAESMQALRQNKISPSVFTNISLLSILGAFLLIIPGVFTDILGLVFRLSFLWTYLAKNTPQGPQKSKFEDDVIDVEVIEHN